MDQIIDDLLLRLTGDEKSESGFDRQTATRAPASEIDGIEKELKGLGTALRAFRELSNAIIHRIAETRTRRNTLAPIHQLPSEIFADILLMSIEEFYCHEQYPTLLENLARVSTSWEAVVQNTPSLWSLISSIHPPAFISKSLSLSKAHPLSISIIPWKTCRLSSESAFLEQVMPHVARWSFAQLHLLSEEAILKLPTLPAPALRDLDLDWWRRDPGEAPDLFGGEAGHLQRATIRIASIRWESGLLSGLRSLVLDRVREQGPSAAQILAMLVASPQLEELHLTSIVFASEGTVANGGPIQLPRLVRLTISGLPFAVTNRLLACIRGPLNKSFHLDCDFQNEGDPLDWLNESLLHFTPVFQSFFTAADHVSFDVYSDSITCRASLEGENVLDVDVIQLRPEPVFARMVDYLNSTPRASELDLCLASHHIRYEETLSYLEKLPHLTTLSVLSFHDIRPILRHLSLPLSTPETTLFWPVPSLERLYLDCYSGCDGDDVLKMIEARYGDGAQSLRENDPKAELPASLELLRIKKMANIDDKTFEGIVSVLGRDHAEWDGPGRGRAVGHPW